MSATKTFTGLEHYPFAINVPTVPIALACLTDSLRALIPTYALQRDSGAFLLSLSPRDFWSALLGRMHAQDSAKIAAKGILAYYVGFVI